MFKKLHFKLTLFNAVILIVFMLLFSCIVYIYINKDYKRKADLTLINAANRVQNLYQIPSFAYYPFKKEKKQKDGTLINLKDRRRIQVNYILWDSDMNITAISQNEDMVKSIAYEYARKAWEEKRSRIVTTEINGGKIHLYSTPFDKNGQQGVVQVYRSIEFERDFISHLMATLIVLELGSMFLLVGIGWFLAGKSLVPIKKSWQQQKDFVADASHELRTPLAVIQTNLEVVLSNPEGTIAENMQWLNNAYTESRVMGKLINDLLLLAKIDAYKIKIQKKVFNLSEVAMEVSERMRQIFENNHIQFKKSIQEGVNLCGDEMRIRQLLLILLDNAVKYTPSGGEVSLKVKCKKNKIEIIVTDTGIGISEEDKKRIFDRFYRVDKARSRDQGGTGLGLSIADWIVKEHKGKIRVNSKLGEGSSFLVEFPAIENF